MKFSKPSFCFITPVSYLEPFAIYSKTHLVLAHLVDTNEQYALFYKNRALFGDFIMMDNSAYELKEPYAPNKLIELGHKCGAHAIVLPDYPFQPGQKTIEAALRFIPLFKDAGFKTFFVPQSQKGDQGDYIETYYWASHNPDIDIIGMSILGMPNAIPYCNPAYARVVMTQILIDAGVFNFNTHHHYLGLNAGPALEIPTLIRMGALDTVDSSGPVWAGILGHGYTKEADSYQMVSKLKLPVDFHAPVTKDTATLERVRSNCLMTLDLFKEENYNKEQTWYAQE